MKNIQLISASAGSGKTYRLMNEIAQRISGKDGTKSVEPEQIMATTFTNKAAAELKERIRMQLLDGETPAKAQRIYDGLIGTVNSICSRLLKEYAFEAGLSPAVDVLLEEDAARIFNMATATAIDESGKTLEPIARRLSLMGYGSSFAKQSDWRDFVRDVVNLARSNAMDAKSLRQSAELSWASLEKLLGTPHSKKMGTDADTNLKDVVAQAVDLIDQGEKVNKPAISTIKRIHEKLNKGWELTWTDRMEIETVEVGKRGSEQVKGLWVPWGSEDLIKDEHLKHPQFRADLKQMISGVLDCAANALEQYAQFKREQGLMDFVDQEALVLKMATDNPSFQASIKERVKLLMVDEFQDTSPMQLALFLKFSELAENVVWVGDQKQSIYGFRGADPILMDAVAAEIEKNSDVVTSDNVLKDSWRSKRELVNFCNEIFAPVFHQTSEDKVRLNIPEQRQKSAEGGWLENWVVEGSNVEKRSSALVEGIDIIIKDRNVKAGDIAVLCRSNTECKNVAKSLNARGIHASIAQGELLATHECTLALAALRYMVDQRDSLALTEVVCFSQKHSGHKSWMQTLLSEPQATRDLWQEDPLLIGLIEAGKKCVHLTPLESLGLAIDTVDLERTVYAWGNVDQRLSNLDQLRLACVEYQDRCKSRRNSATVTGFLTWLDREAELKQAESSGKHTVNVLTYHKSKGLEWPVVIMTSLNKESKNRLFGVSVSEADTFQAEEPLNGRSIRFWPWPYGTKKKAPALDKCLAGSEIAKASLNNALSESQRVLYVGMTRARDGLILVQEKSKNDIEHKWLDELTDKNGRPVLHYGEGECRIIANDDDHKVFEVTSRNLTELVEEEKNIKDEICYLPAQHDVTEYPVASLAPSSASWSKTLKEEDVVVLTSAVLGERLKMTGKPEMADFGNAMHGFLGADNPEASKEKRIQMAEGLLERWDVQGSIASEDMLDASNRLHQFIKKKFPDAKVLHEWPVAMRNNQNQVIDGWIDLLIEMPDGYVIIDHKSYPGSDGAEHAKQYAPQLAIYKKAVEAAMDKPVLEQLIHMQMIGAVYKVT